MYQKALLNNKLKYLNLKPNLNNNNNNNSNNNNNKPFKNQLLKLSNVII